MWGKQRELAKRILQEGWRSWKLIALRPLYTRSFSVDLNLTFDFFSSSGPSFLPYQNPLRFEDISLCSFIIRKPHTCCLRCHTCNPMTSLNCPTLSLKYVFVRAISSNTVQRTSCMLSVSPDLLAFLVCLFAFFVMVTRDIRKRIRLFSPNERANLWAFDYWLVRINITRANSEKFRVF